MDQTPTKHYKNHQETTTSRTYDLKPPPQERRFPHHQANLYDLVVREREREREEMKEMWETESWRENKEINKILYNLATVRSQK